DRIDCRLGDGLSVLAPGEAEVIVIAGMGGMLMARILREFPEVTDSARHLVLSPHRDAFELRKYLWEQGFDIEDEAMVREDGKYYPVIRTKKQKAEADPACEAEEQPNDLQLRFGPVLLRKRPTVFQDYLKELYQKTEAELRHLKGQEASASVAHALKVKREELSAVREALIPADREGRLRIRKMTEEDLAVLSGLLADPDVMKYLEDPYGREKAEHFLRTAGLCDPPRIFAVEEDGRFIGYVIFHEYDENSMEIGWVLQRERWGKGIASRLTEMLLAAAFSMEKDAVIECDPAQHSTRHLALKYGFLQEEDRDGLEVYRLKRPQT
ncbi:MAG: tRNA (adenine(22)-N(1))-methyltransferase TrmK, partial [Lachnospiraceae bacterium]|nr:tRNA (adenine(22)-N(1))-methyltransferase TrmK [Lachnospiraceae bacterium]